MELILILCLTLFSACSRQQPAASPVEQAPLRQIDACALLTSSEIESVQGEPLKETIPANPSAAAYTIAQCYYALPANTNSILLTVTQRGSGAGAKEPREFWEETFHGTERRGGEGEEHEEKRKAPLKVEGVGEEAYWLGSAVGGALYVLKGNLYLRISTGGNEQLERTKRIAQIVLGKL